MLFLPDCAVKDLQELKTVLVAECRLIPQNPDTNSDYEQAQARRAVIYAHGHGHTR